ncbi:MAG: hypothetical protein IJ721_07150 [Bacteroidales bacterium]|nr:hypothetical protein [Bacteroidales bacterium]
MKRILLFTASVAMLMPLASCKKDKKAETVDPTKPAVVWETNPSFDTKEKTKSLDAVITVKAEGRIEALTLTLDLGEYNILANQYIGTAVNKGSSTKQPVFDMVDDTECAKFLAGIGITAGTILRGKAETDVNLVAVLNALLGSQPVENDKTFSIKVDVVDREGNTASRTARFHYTAAPEFTWEKNTTFAVVDLDDPAIDAVVKVWAPGKVETLTITLAEDADPELVKYVKNRTGDSGLVINLVDDAVAGENFKNFFPSGTAVAGAENVTLDFAFMYDKKPDLSASTNVFTVHVVDQNGEDRSVAVKFKKK